MSTTTTPVDHGCSASSARWHFARESGNGTDGWQIEWQLKRNCSLAPGQMLGFFGALCMISLTVATYFWHQGAKMVMPFAWAELIAVGSALYVYARHAADRERIALRRNVLTVEHACGNRVERVEFQCAWVRVEPRSGDGSLIELSGQGHQISVGRFIRPELRRKLADELRRAIRHAHQQPASAA